MKKKIGASVYISVQITRSSVSIAEKICTIVGSFPCMDLPKKRSVQFVWKF